MCRMDSSTIGSLSTQAYREGDFFRLHGHETSALWQPLPLIEPSLQSVAHRRGLIQIPLCCQRLELRPFFSRETHGEAVVTYYCLAHSSTSQVSRARSA